MSASPPVSEMGRAKGGLLVRGLLIAVIAANLFVSLWVSVSLPIEGDGRLYHAPRAMYWIQSHSIGPIESATTQLMVMPYGTDLIFAGAVALTGSETAGKLAMWLGHPLLVVVAWLLLTTLGAGRTLKWALVALVSTVGLIPGLLMSLQPEIYQTVWVLGCVTAWMKAREDGTRDKPKWLALATALGVLAISAKPTSAPFLLLVIYELLHDRRLLGKSVAFVCISGITVALFSGLFLTAFYTWKWFGRPFSIGPMEAEIYREPSLGRFAVHVFRFIVALLNPLTPEVGKYLGMSWLTELANSIETALRTAAAAIGMHREFAQETPGLWPGPFRYIAQGGAGNAGLFNILGLGAAIWSAARIRKERVSIYAIISLLSLGCIAAELYLLRWQSGMPRFLLFAVALWIVPLAELGNRYRILTVLVCALAVVQGVAVIAGTVAFCRSYQIDGSPDIAMFSLRPVGTELPPNAKLLFVGSSTTYEYDLWGNGRKIYPWGRHPYEKVGLDRMLTETGADYVLLDDCARFPGMQNACPFGYDDFERELDLRLEWERVPIALPKTPVTDRPEDYLVLYQRSGVR